jgi:CubicO group peptidase (beta-lactamase class C family)
MASRCGKARNLLAQTGSLTSVLAPGVPVLTVPGGRGRRYSVDDGPVGPVKVTHVTEVHGFCGKRFGPVRRALAESLDDQDVGASAAVFLDGEPVVDIWGGHADAARTVAWERDTIVNVWSTSKTMLGPGPDR